MRHDELYNAIRERLNKLIPERLELKAGCEFFVEVEQNKRVVMENHLGKLRSFGEGFLFENSVEKMEKYATILGTPPTLQEILFALGQDPSNCTDYITVYGKMMVLDNGNRRLAFEYDLTKPVKEQETSTLQAIYDLLV